MKEGLGKSDCSRALQSLYVGENQKGTLGRGWQKTRRDNLRFYDILQPVPTLRLFVTLSVFFSH